MSRLTRRAIDGRQGRRRSLSASASASTTATPSRGSRPPSPTPKRPDADKVKLIELLGQVRRPASLPVLLDLFRDAQVRRRPRGRPDRRCKRYDDPKVGDELLATYPEARRRLQQQAARHPALAAGDGARRPASRSTPRSSPQGRSPSTSSARCLDFKDAVIDQLVEKHCGKLAPATPGEKQARIAWLQRRARPRDRRRRKRQGAVHQALRRVPHALRRGRQGRPGPDHRRPQEPRVPAHAHRRSVGVHPPGVRDATTSTTDGRRLSGLVDRVDRGERSRSST